MPDIILVILISSAIFNDYSFTPDLKLAPDY